MTRLLGLWDKKQANLQAYISKIAKRLTRGAGGSVSEIRAQRSEHGIRSH
jgi:hypothetical protein